MRRLLRRPAFIHLRCASLRSFSSQEGKFEAAVTCLPGLEPILTLELQSLGIQHTRSKRVLPGWDLHDATLSDLYNCHLHLGTASRILLRCGADFSARALGELRRKVQMESAPWIDRIQDGADLEVRATASKSRLYHTGAVAERVAEGIQSVLGSRAQTKVVGNDGDSPPLSHDRPRALRLHVSVFRDVVSIWMDTSSGSPLHQRGYRLETAKAPLREDLSFALLYAAGWRPTTPAAGSQEAKKAASKSTKHLLDPFCGSGTIVIEAAAIASGIPPGRLRPPPFQGTQLHDASRWHDLVSQYSVGASRDAVRCVVHGSDRDKGAIAAARANARRMGVLDAIDLQHCAFSAHPFLENPEMAPRSLLIASNPPFGRRVASARSVAGDSKLGGNDDRRRTVSPLLPMFQRLSDRFGALVSRPKYNARSTSMVLLSDSQPLVQRAFSGFRQDVVLRSSHGGIPVYGVLLRHS